jgi:uncharacterized protein
MTAIEITVLLCAGLVGGVMNAMAGGASLVTFPALLAVGLPPIIANASNALAVSSSNFVAAFNDRKLIPAGTPAFWAASFAALVGGAFGGWLLLRTTEQTFVLLVPILIGFGTLVFALGKFFQSKARNLFGRHAQGPVAVCTLLFPVTTYGGYFGAGLGVMLMAALNVTSDNDLRTTNAFKNLLGVLTNAIAIVIFITYDLISWPQTFVMMLGCSVGGLIGTRLLSIISTTTMRKIIIAAGTAMTLIYAYRYWLPK